MHIIYALMLGVSNKNQLMCKNHFIHLCLWSLEFIHATFYLSDIHPVIKPSAQVRISAPQSSTTGLQQSHCILQSSRYLEVHSPGAMWGIPMYSLCHSVHVQSLPQFLPWAFHPLKYRTGSFIYLVG